MTADRSFNKHGFWDFFFFLTDSYWTSLRKLSSNKKQTEEYSNIKLK